MPHATAAILSIGDELTLGQNLDTNSQWLSHRLTALGVIPIQHATVPDDLAATRDAILRLADVADLVIITGGLGPTADDLTRAALAAAMNEPLVEDLEALAQITAWFASRTRPMPALNRVQAQRPRSAAIIRNDWGTAPGMQARLQKRDRQGASDAAAPLSPAFTDIFSLPGPPREMRPMFEASVLPHIKPARTVRTRALPTFGLGESEIATRLGSLMDRDRNPTVGTTASHGVVTVRIRFEASPQTDPASASRAIAEVESKARAALGSYIFGADADTQSSVIRDLLKERNLTLATVESCTGGLLGELITETPGSSAIYRGGFITYTNELKQQLVGVPAATFAPGGPGAVSRECAEAMARGGLAVTGADFCLSITGIAGPDGGSAEKPIGTVWIALASRESVHSRRFQFSGERSNIRDWSARSALAMLRFAIIGQPSLALMRQTASHPTA
jgi:nicotinamide-nucleotide amidase